MPAVVRRRPVSGGAIRLEEGTTRCPRSSKKRRNSRRMSFPFIRRASVPVALGSSRSRWCWTSAHQVLGEGHPEFGGQTKRFLVDSLVVAMEHGGELGEGDHLAEQARSVGYRARPAEEPGVG